MKCLLVTSALTFIPENYDEFVLPMLKNPAVGGLLELQNRDSSFLTKGFALILSGAGPRLGSQLLKNWHGNSSQRRREISGSLGKPFRQAENPHDPETLSWIAENKFDLILNARTRTIYRKVLLNSVPLGCLNIHHGLLPDQRGLMCDFWSHLEGQPAGFSVHVMTPKLDDGPILNVTEVKTDRKNYMHSLREGARREAEVCTDLLAQIARHGLPAGVPNRSDDAVYRRNPGLRDFYKMAFKGIRR